MPLSSQSFFQLETDNSRKSFATAALNSSYMIYNQMTWSMWLGQYPNTNKTIWAQWETVAGNLRSWLFSGQADGTVRLIFSPDGTNFSLDKTVLQILDGSWFHFAVTFNNGVYAAKKNNVTLALANTLPWGGGSAPLFASNVRHAIGTIDPSSPPIDNSCSGCFTNFSLWNKVLNSAEIQELYNGGVPGDLDQHSAKANRVAWIRADQSETPPTLVDQNNSAANMTITKVGANSFFNQTGQVPNVVVTQSSTTKTFLMSPGGTLETVVEDVGPIIQSSYVCALTLDLGTNRVVDKTGTRSLNKRDAFNAINLFEQFLIKDPNKDFG